MFNWKYLAVNIVVTAGRENCLSKVHILLLNLFFDNFLLQI